MKNILLIGPMLKKAPDLSAFQGMTQVAVDGGIRHAPQPSFWVGDGDSGEKPAHIPTFFKESQDETDFARCLKLLREKTPETLHLFGFLGGRRSHEWAVLGDIALEMRATETLGKACFYAEEGKMEFFMMRAGSHEVALDAPTGFSILTTERAVVKISGECKYQAENLELPAFSGRGVSNEAFGNIAITSSAPCIVCFD